MTDRPITMRMAQTLRVLSSHWGGRRRPKAFYLIESDWNEFMATKPPTIRTMWGNNPPTSVEDPAFQDVPVRLSTGKQSRLYDNTTTGRNLSR